MEIIVYLLLALLVFSLLLLILCGAELVKLDKQNVENIVVPSVEEIKFPTTMSRWEVDRAIRQACKTDKQMAKMRARHRRIICN